MKTLYITDLDGTLLRDDQTLSKFASDNLNFLLEKGLCFSYATARSANTSLTVLKEIQLPIAAVVYNGAFVIDTNSGEKILSNAFNNRESSFIIDSMLSHNIFPRVYAIIGETERFTYTEEHLISDGAKEYFRTRKEDKRARLGTSEMLYEGEIFLISCCNTKEKLLPLYEELKSTCFCHFYRDNYSRDWYLEIVPHEATKEKGALKLKELFGCDKMVAFGDGINDIPLFKAADESYAVANACPELKKIATGLVASNEEDGVVQWLLDNAKIN